MSLFDLSSWFTGQNETARGQADDAALATLNNADYAPGGTIYNNILATQGQSAADNAYVLAQAGIANDEAQTANYNSDVSGAFVGGLKTGLNNVIATLENPFWGIPLAWYVIAFIVVFFWIGGAGYVRGILNKKK